MILVCVCVHHGLYLGAGVSLKYIHKGNVYTYVYISTLYILFAYG